MSKDPAVLFYTSDFLTGTSFFTMEQKGQYITLLCQQHQLGYLPENHMINICGSLDSPVINKFIRTDDGNYFNERMKNESDKRKLFCLSRATNKLGKIKDKNMCKSYDKHMYEHMDNENDNKDLIINIVDYLNNVMSTSYRYTSIKTKECIKARINEGFTFDDFKLVVDKKHKEWAYDEKFCKFLRPETLFSNKFEGYLNQIEKQNKVVRWDE